MSRKIKGRSFHFSLLALFLLSSATWCKESAADATVVLNFGFLEEISADLDRSGNGHQAQELLIKTSVLTASMPKDITDSKQGKSDQAAEDSTEEESD